MRFSILFGLLSLSLNAAAMSVDWSGVYRFEWLQVDRPSLTTPPMSKAYGLNYLGLGSKIIASDGIEINAKFDVLSSADNTYSKSQAGQLWGQDFATAPDTHAQNETKDSSTMKVRELYLNVSQEYGSLLVGRAPFNFGLGMKWNAGNGPFDHWTTTEDLVAYKFIVGNMFLMPKISRVYQENFAAANTIQDQAVQFGYESEDSGSMLGAIVSNRKSSQGSNDAPATLLAAASGTTGTVTDAYSMQTTSFVLGRKWESFRFRMEASFTSGTYGVRTAKAEDIRNNSYGVAIEMDFPRPDSKWSTQLRLGAASGDDPNTADNEGFQFSRNYDVAMLLFNHRLGQKDFLRTYLIRETTTHGLDNSIDDETISNASYISPKITYAWNDRWDIANTLTYAQLMVNPTNSVDFKKDLGLEWDIGFVYKPRVNVRWVNELGLLFPGGAFKDGASDLQNGFTYGFATKAAITF